LAGIALRGMDVNIFVQVGFVVLVGLACKNAILIIEFARDRQHEGASRFDAVMDTARTRLRPILMTSACFVHMVPPYFATGAGAEMRRSLGTAVLWGAFGVTLFGIFLTPVFFYVVRWFSDREAVKPALVHGPGAAEIGMTPEGPVAEPSAIDAGQQGS
jgi:multidrug efflux pump